MSTVDSLLRKIINSNFNDVESKLPARDSKVLKNLARIIDDPVYITENQGKLLVKILAEHKKTFVNFIEEVETVTSNPVWAKPFRVIQVVKKIYINNAHGTQRITIETTFSSDLRNKILQLAKTVSGLIQETPGKLFSADLTEKNIAEVIDKLSPVGFDISDELKDYYKTIKAWSENEIQDQYRITTISYPNFEKQIINDLGIDTSIDQNIIKDRSIRYQYFVENSEKTPENLVEILAYRKQPKVWIDKNRYTLDEVFKSLGMLKRLPTLVVFDSNDSEKCLEKLKKLSDALEKNGISDGVGIYFRLDNDKNGREFNQLIADKKYNCRLDGTTKVVGVQSGKIPKFLLKTDWKPMSVVSLNIPLRHSKTAVYANSCDLIITCSNQEPLIEGRYTWE